MERTNYGKTGIKIIRAMGGRKPVTNFLQKIYENKNNLYLQRKYEKVQSCFSEINGISTNIQFNNEIGTTQLRIVSSIM